MLLTALLVLALTRAEIIERFKTPPITTVAGFVSVYADCDAEQRREFQQPVSDYVSNICRELLAADNIKEKHRESPAIVVHIQDGRGPNTNVLAQVIKRTETDRFTRIHLPSPKYSDMDALRNEIVRAYYLVMHEEEITAPAAAILYAELNPATRANHRMAEVAAWRRAGTLPPGKDDEEMLKEMRKVHIPGAITPAEMKVFAARLNLYPATYHTLFAGHYRTLSFREAIDVAQRDPAVRQAAADKVPELLLFGSGHGLEMESLVKSYSVFLLGLASDKMQPKELHQLLDVLESKMKGMMK